MAWIEMHQSLPTHRKTLALSDALKIEPVHAVGHLACLWMWALDNAPNGDLAGVGARTIARAAHWKKSADAFVAAMTSAGFIEDERIHDWPDYAGRLLERRRRDADRKRTGRGIPADVPPQSTGHPPDIPGTSGASRAHITQPDPTGPNTPPTPPGETRKAAPKPKPERVPITDQDTEDLIGKYAERYGTPQAVRDEIELALNHSARLKNFKERIYVDGWLRRELTHRPALPGNSRNGRPEPERRIVDHTGVAP